MSSWGASADFSQPFIGLRPFEYNDRKYFFGRDDEVDVLELQVKQNRFVAVVGRSGCGKSSLISAGLRPRLEKVYDHRWCWIGMRTDDAPLRQLALGLAGLTGETGDLSEAWADRFERVLTKSCFGIGEALGLIPALRGSDGGRVLLFVDQFEELFRFADLGPERSLDPVTVAERRDEATRFVRLLLTAMKLPRPSLHIIVSIRSDFIGDCARFHGLPEAVSRSQFLVPDMTRDQRESVIRKPVQLAGGQIDPRLVQRALNDGNDDPNHLPNLQHSMVRCWERALHRGKREVDRRPHLTIDDYTTSAPS
jgi:energy-coupling factor transporter ATP-binding protein EcfA2